MADNVIRLEKLMSSVLTWMDMDMPTEYKRPWGHCADDLEMKMSVNEWRWRSSRAPLSLINRSPSSHQLHDDETIRNKKCDTDEPSEKEKARIC
ncbi:hypothetical protein CY34DRAFT_805129 [Suillus luteus UH-Slu-Lm8-n1]|uniref:Uncharacterized protein n=1 Tax=Suillus luteus UH-Slu-Lm8-n1 TaxID=930992 RepID=A0A0C9ZWP7_9AGAM|nr:hypothetical protein CY34DRAFT_805129 [Suillus luteus UH-Slu-Lm8-n1]